MDFQLSNFSATCICFFFFSEVVFCAITVFQLSSFQCYMIFQWSNNEIVFSVIHV